jgi:hypothetical protein
MHPANKHYQWQNYIYNKFISMNALCEANAKSLEELELSSDLIFSNLMTTGVIIQVKDRYYLNENKAIQYFRKRSIIISAAVVILLLLALIGYLTVS